MKDFLRGIRDGITVLSFCAAGVWLGMHWEHVLSLAVSHPLRTLLIAWLFFVCMACWLVWDGFKGRRLVSAAWVEEQERIRRSSIGGGE